MTCYSLDLRKSVISQVEKGESVYKISALFGISRQTIYNWKKLQSKDSLRAKNNLKRRPKKICPTELESYVKKNPDATLKEMAKHFKCTTSSVHYRLKKCKISYKKKSFYILKEMKKKERNIKINCGQWIKKH